MHDGVYPFELSVVSFDVILKCSSFIRDPVVFSYRIYIDGSAGPYPRACPMGSTNPVCWKVPVTGGTRFSEVGWPSGGVHVLGSPGLFVYLFCCWIGLVHRPCRPKIEK